MKDAIAEQAEQSARAKGMVDLDEASVLSMLGERSDTSEPAKQGIQSTETPTETHETEPVKTSEETITDETDQDEVDPEELLFLSVDEKPKKHREPDESKMAPEERRRLWQSKYDRERELRIRLEARLAALEERLKDSAVQPIVEPKPRDVFPTEVKSPSDFMPSGMEFVQYDADDPNTPSGIAMRKYREYVSRSDREALKREVLESVRAEQQRIEQQRFLERQVEVLRKRANIDDDQIREFIAAITAPREDQLYLMYLAHQISQGRIPIKRADLPKIINAYRPNGNGKGSAIQNAPSASPKKTSIPAELTVYADFANATL